MGKRPKPNWDHLRAALWQRSRGRCEISGRPLNPQTFDAHHRRPKGSGGTYRPDTDTVVNLLALDPDVHNGGPGSVHGAPQRSYRNGWLVPKHRDDPHLWPVLLHDGRWVLLTPDGGYMPVGPPGACE